MSKTPPPLMIPSLLAALFFSLSALGQEPAPKKPADGYTDTPLLPGGRWHVHDSGRPRPPVVTPGTCSTQETPGQPPSDALVLFNGGDTSQWRGDKGQPAPWKVQDGALVAGGGDLFTQREFGDIQLHVEFATPAPPRGQGQGRGNSGVFLLGLYEFQVLDSYENETYADGQAAAMYGQHPPLVNASRPPGQWQTYDLVFLAPRFQPDGQLKSPPYLTAFHNGVLVQYHAAYLGPTGHRSLPSGVPAKGKGPIKLQAHGNPVRYRNLWVRPLSLEEDKPPVP